MRLSTFFQLDFVLVDTDYMNESVDYLKLVATKRKLLKPPLSQQKHNSLVQVDSAASSEHKREEMLSWILKSQVEANKLSKNMRVNDLVSPICQLCHLSVDLAHQTWVQIFAQMFNLLNAKQQQNLSGELTPFFSSSSHCIQKQLSSSAINTFFESLPFIAKQSNLHLLLENASGLSTYLKPSVMTYLAKNHNLWHRCILFLENILLLCKTSSHSLASSVRHSDELYMSQSEAFSSLSQLYSLLREEDYRVGLWQLKAIHENTKLALIFDQHGLFYQEQKLLEEMIAKSIDIYLNETIGPNQVDELLEYNLWEEKWVNCCKELNQWNELAEYANSKGNDMLLNLECEWKSQQQTIDWQTIKAILMSQKEQNISRENLIRLSLYQSYYLVCNPDDHHNMMLANLTGGFSSSSIVEAKVERLIHMVVKEWRRLPKLLSPAHVNLLQLSQQIVELQEAFQIQNGLYSLTQLNLQQQQQQTQQLNMHLNPASVLQEIKGLL